MSIMNLPLQQILDELQYHQIQHDEYHELFMNYILDGLEISPDDLKNLEIDQYHRVINIRLNELKESENMIKDLKKKFNIIKNDENKWDIRF